MSKQITKPDYADIKPVSHDMDTLVLMMEERNKSEIDTLRTVNELASEPYNAVKKQHRIQNRIKNAGLYASFVLLLFTTMILFMSPMIQQTKYEMNDWRVWGIAAIMFSVALAVAYVIDIGRSHILGKANNSKKDWMHYTSFGIISIIISTTGLMALADFYESKQQASTEQAITDARNFIASNSGLANTTAAQINAKRKPFLAAFALKGSGYGKVDKLRDMTRIDQELANLQTYNNAVTLIDNRNVNKSTANSSNWLFNTYAVILNTGVKMAAIIVGLAIGLTTEAMMLVSHTRLIKLNARLEVTEQQWSAATMAANEAMIVANSTIVSLNHIDYFAHAFKMPFNILNQYQNQNRKYGDFVDADYEDAELNDKMDNTLNEKQIEAQTRYALAKNAKHGSNIECPSCALSFKKKTYNHYFCSSKGANNCKDEYHNLMTPERIAHAISK